MEAGVRYLVLLLIGGFLIFTIFFVLSFFLSSFININEYHYYIIINNSIQKEEARMDRRRSGVYKKIPKKK